MNPDDILVTTEKPWLWRSELLIITVHSDGSISLHTPSRRWPPFEYPSWSFLLNNPHINGGISSWDIRVRLA